MSDSAIDRLVATWDDAVAQFIGGETSVTPDLESWFTSYAGRGVTSVEERDLWQPWHNGLLQLRPPHQAALLL